MEEKVQLLLKNEFKEIQGKQIDAVLGLLKEGNTVPFIARYRKEATGSLDEVQIKDIQERFHYLENIEKRKSEVLRLIDEQGKLDDDLRLSIEQAKVLQTVEDLYRPFKQKRRTKAVIAKEAGLEPLALSILSLNVEEDLTSFASAFINETIETAEDALLGAHEIMAETFGDEAKYRTAFRRFTLDTALIKTSIKDESLDTRAVYEMYYNFSQKVQGLQGHRILAINRAEKEGVIKVELELDETRIHDYFYRDLIAKHEDSESVRAVILAYKDAYKRFIGPAIEREIRNELTEIGENGAIEVFGENLRNLLLQAPLKGKVVMGFDPAYRTGCKLAIVDATGKLLKIKVIYPHASSEARHQESIKIFRQLLEEYRVEMIAIGNGTASRESEVFVSENIKNLNKEVFYLIVNEAGASIYSASDIARKEFPDLQVEERSAISIARRVQDPLAELVKIDPQSVGVGQYQHDVSQKNLKTQLDFVVETAVNQVGVDVNTASAALLEHVAGLSKTTAQNIILERESLGFFSSRKELKSVPRLGPKSYEQSIGFLRIPKGENILDNTGIHPETYKETEKLLKLLKIKHSDLGSEEANEKLNHISLNEISETLEVGKETLTDIVSSLMRPGRDMRDDMASPLLRSDVLTMEDLKEGMSMNGTVRNVVDFGAFVDIGVKQDGLVHISKISKQFIKHPSALLSVGDVVKVTVVGVDLKKERIQLSMVEETKKA